MLTAKQRQYLTELLGECWHKSKEEGYGFVDFCDCCKCHKIFAQNRTFLTWQDFGDVVRVIDFADLALILGNYNDEIMNKEEGFAFAMQQPTFIEDFMKEVAKQGGINEK